MQTVLTNKLIKITGLDIFKPTRARDYVEARALLMYVFYKYLGMSKSAIARYFKDRGKSMNHATVIHHLKAWEFTVKYNPALARDLNDLLGQTQYMDMKLQTQYIQDKAPLLTKKNIEDVYLLTRDMYEDVLSELEKNAPQKVDPNTIAN